MIITELGRDLININEKSLRNITPENKKKTHIIKLEFDEPTEDKMNLVFDFFPFTNRFIIEDNIKFYNWFFKSNNKKYYVENYPGCGIFSFFKKNNKIMLNFDKLDYLIYEFLMYDEVFCDILRNLEIIQIDDFLYNEKYNILTKWSGNVVIKWNENEYNI